jgi:hypothetical protein
LSHSERYEEGPGTPGLSALPNGVGKKFDADGSVRRFPGNTVLCHLPLGSTARGPLQGIHSELQNSGFAQLYTLLPPPSWHMTVFEGVCDEIREPDLWPQDLSRNAPFDECNALFDKKLRRFDLNCTPPYRMRIGGWRSLVNGIMLRLLPMDEAEEQRLRGLRNRLSALLQIRSPSHDTYGFHLSFAYLVKSPSTSEEAGLGALLEDSLPLIPDQIDFGLPEFCCFDDMFEFRRQFYLGDNGAGLALR